MLSHLIWCSPFRQGSSPKNFLVKIRVGSTTILRIGTDFLLVGVLGAVSKHSPRPLSALSLCFKPRMPIRRSGTERCRATPVWRVTFTNCIRYFPTADFLKNIAAEEGVDAGLYKGFVANALRSVGCALVFVLYDRAKTYLSINCSTRAASAFIIRASFIVH